jgi:hypothetical protein
MLFIDAHIGVGGERGAKGDEKAPLKANFQKTS